MATNENLPPRVIKELARELKNLDECPPEDIRVIVNDDNFSTIYAEIDGPSGTPYVGGVFRMKLVLNQDFPHTPPRGYFITKIFHPNISKNGEICVNTLKKDWKPTLGLRHVLLVVRCLLIEPFPESALNEEAGKMLMEDYEEYAKLARLMTRVHAVKPRAKTKVAIGESAVINAVPTDIVSSTQVVMSASGVLKELCADAALSCTTETNVSAGVTSSSRKPEGDVGSVKLLSEKKKIDARKKSLRRL